MKTTLLWPAVIATFGLGLAGCHQDMWEQPKVKAQSRNTFFSDNRGTRMPLTGTVSFGSVKKDVAFYSGYENGKLVREFPVPVTAELIKHGQERFRAFCLHCHGEIGDGQGMIAKRGFTLARPVGNYHTQRLRDMPVGHFFDVITNGYGTMYPFAARIKPYDRWAIASYIRVLQLSQYAPVADLDSPLAQRVGLPQSTMNQGPLFVTPTNAPTTIANPAMPTAPAKAPTPSIPMVTAPVTTEGGTR